MLTGQEVRDKLLSLKGQERENFIASSFLGGNWPEFMTKTATVTYKMGNNLIKFMVMSDYLCLGTDDDYVICPVNMLTSQRMADALGCVLPTYKLVDMIYAQADVKLPAKPWGPPYDNSMFSSERFIEQSKKDVTERKLSKYPPIGSLTAGHRKDYVVDPSLVSGRTAIYGWVQANGQVIQKPVQSKFHESTYVDYSQAPRFVWKNVWVGDNLVHYSDFLKDPVLCKVLVDHTTSVWRHPDVPEPTVPFEAVSPLTGQQ
jgi:hypothetical protein